MKIFQEIISKLGVNSQEFSFQFQSHPNYPSALAFSDTLNFLGVKNNAYELEKEYWHELPDEFIVLIDQSFSLVKKKGSYYTIYSDKIKNISKDELHKNSSNFVLLFEKINNDNTVSFLNLKPFIFLVFGVIILFNFLQFTWYENIFNLLSLFGVYISLELFQQKFGQESVLVNNICTGSTNTHSPSSCSKIFSSDKTNIFGLKLSDLSLIYFLGISLISLLFPNSQFILKGVSIGSIGVVLYSLYIQMFVGKSLCRICLVLISILIFQILVSSLYFNWIVSINIIFTSAILLIVLFLTLVYINNLFTQNQELKKSNIKNQRFKRDYNRFKRELLENEKIEFTDNETFLLGNKHSKFHISIVSNPYCEFCKGSHKILENILEKYSDQLSVQIRFNYSPSHITDEKYTRLLSNFVNIYTYKSEYEFLKAIKAWFKNHEENDIEKYITTNKFEDLSNIIQMTNENYVSGITFTPVFIVNGYKFPDKYEREDILLFIEDLLEDNDF